MPSTCQFQLTNPNGVYFSGETISGTIILTTTSLKKVRDVRLLFEGEAKVKWSETKRERNADGSHSNRTVHFRGSIVYVNESTVLAGEGTLPPGTYRYNVQIHLPLACPTSCEGRYGHIRYQLTLKLNRPFYFDNVFTKPLTVIRTVDLNLSPDLRIPLEDEEIFEPCCWFCPSGNINTKLILPYGGYVSGQRVNYTVFIQNHSMNDINGYTLEFIRTMTFTAQTPHRKTRYDKTTLFKESYNKSCLRLSTRLFKGAFPIYSTAPSSERDSIISVSYILKVTLILGSCTWNKAMKVEVIIGTVPIRESLLPPTITETTQNNSLIEAAPSAPEVTEDADSNSNDLPPSYHDVGPPTFEEATRSSSPFIDIDKDERHRHIGFRPLYPMYSNIHE